MVNPKKRQVKLLHTADDQMSKVRNGTFREMNEFRGVDLCWTSRWMEKVVWTPLQAWIPKAVHPNHITAVTLCLVLVDVVLLWITDNSLAYPSRLPWLYFLTSLFCQNHLDALDGIHARRTGQTSRRGEFLDHFVDIVRMCIVQPLLCISACGFVGFSASDVLLVMMSFHINAFLAFFTQESTGVLFYSFTYDISIYLLLALYARCRYIAIYAPQEFLPLVWVNFYQRFGLLIKVIAFGNTLLIVVPQYMHIWYKHMREKGHGTASSIVQPAMRISTFALTAILFYWWQSKTSFHLLSDHPVVLLTLFGLVASEQVLSMVPVVQGSEWICTIIYCVVPLVGYAVSDESTVVTAIHISLILGTIATVRRCRAVWNLLASN